MTQKKQKEIIRHFLKFLKENGAYQMYKANLMKDVNRNNYVGFTYGIQLKILYNPSGSERNFTIYLAEELINYAFCWSDTPQQHGFWYKLSEEWRKYVHENLYHKYKHIISEF